MNRLVAFLPALALLGACTPSMEITKPPVAYQTVRSFPAQSFRGDGETTVRTRIDTANGAREVSGANCTLSTTYTTSQFQTPAKVITPNLGPATPSATLRCETADRQAQTDLSPTNLSLAERSQRARTAGAGGGLIGVLAGGVMAGINEGRGDRPTDVHGYRPSYLKLETPATANSNP